MARARSARVKRAAWRNRVAGDACPLEGLGIGTGHQRQGVTPEAPDRADEYGIVGGGGIEILAPWPSLFGEDLRYVEVVRRIADRHGDDSVPGLGFSREVGDAVLDVLDRTQGPERRINTLEALAIHVSMTVDQTGDDGLALQIDDAGGRCRMRAHCRILADGDDPLAGDGDRLGDRRISVDRDDFGVLENEVGRSRS